MTSYENSVSTWLKLLSDGDDNAIEAAFNRYFARLTRLATSKMTGLNQAIRSGEDVALSAFRSFCSGLKAHRLVVDEENNLWACLFRIVTRKACAERRRALTLKRGGQFKRIDSVQIDADGAEEDILTNVAGREPSPEFALEMAERGDEILNVFGQDETRRRIVELKLLGYSVSKIASAVRVGNRTVYWHLKEIRQRLEFVSSVELLFDELFSGSSFEVAAERAGWTTETARNVVNAALELWRKESGEIFDGSSEYDPVKTSNLPGVGDSGIKLELWKSRLRKTWTDSLLETFEKSSNSLN